jgi:hypothetical protein
VRTPDPSCSRRSGPGGHQARRPAAGADLGRGPAVQPAPNPAESTDARYRKYAKEFGHQSWEFDALESTVLGQLVRDAVDSRLDHDRRDAAVEREQAGAARLQAVSRRWAEVEALVG